MDKEKLEKMTSEVRQKAVEVDRALKNAKKAKAKAQRTATAPSTPTDDEGDPLNFNQTIESGTALQRALLYLSDFDAHNTFGKGILTKGQNTRLKESFKTQEERNILQEIGRFYDSLINYTKYLIGLRKMWQTEAGNIALLCQKWEHYDREAEGWSAILKQLYKGSMTATNDNGEPIDLHSAKAVEEFFRKFWQGDPKEATLKAVQTSKDDEGRPLYRLEADVDIKGGLYSRIEEQQETAQGILDLFRSGSTIFRLSLSDVPLQTGGEIFPYTALLPRNAEMILDHPDAISFMRDPQGEKYFAYRIRQRREAGETITPEEEHRAVIPDYNQATETPHGLDSAERHLRKYFPNYYPLKKKKKQ